MLKLAQHRIDDLETELKSLNNVKEFIDIADKLAEEVLAPCEGCIIKCHTCIFGEVSQLARRYINSRKKNPTVLIKD